MLIQMAILYMMEILALAAPPLIVLALFSMCLGRLKRLLKRMSWRVRRRMRRLLRDLLQILLLRR